MKRVRRQHTAVEQKLAAELQRNGLRFLTHQAICGCKPDIVFSYERVAVFVDGDFWHGRVLLESGRRALLQSFKPQGQAFWVAKISSNADRDRRQSRILRRNGWSVLRIWEKDVLRDPSDALATIYRRLRRRRAQLKRQLNAV
jgi:DNA mismatch endonuclease, patch repair protein